MSANSKIEWTDHTFNPWIGCTKVSPGCKNCYAEQRDKRHLIEKVDHWGKGAPRLRTSASNWRQPIKWNAKAGDWDGIETFGGEPIEHHRPRVFCASLADIFDDEIPIEWLADFLALVHKCQNLDFQILTKRPENWNERLHAAFRQDSSGDLDFVSAWLDGYAPDNVWLGTSVEDQTRADERIPQLLQIPARVRFLSCEPLLGSVNLRRWLRPTICSQCGQSWNEPACGPTHATLAADAGIHWVIVGGESGPNARECNVRWPMQLGAQCKKAGVPVFVKQLGTNIVDRNDAGFDGESEREWPMDTRTRDIDSGYQGAPVRVLLRNTKGGDPSEWPESLRVRQFPSVSSAVTA